MWKRRFLGEEETRVVGEALQPVLVDLIDISLLAKQAHWNLRGPEFLAVHEKLDEITEAARNFGDQVAERLVMIGVAPDGRRETVAARSNLGDFPEGFISVREALTLMADKLHVLVRGLREARAAVEEADAVTEDLLIEISGQFEEHLWMLQASEFSTES